MLKLDLAGVYILYRDDRAPIAGKLPGCTYLDYMANGMADPFAEMNETEAKKLAEHDYRYSGTFVLNDDILAMPHIDFVGDGLDTLCHVVVNGTEIGFSDNIYRVWRFDLKPYVRAGINTLDLRFDNPYPYIEKKNAENPLPKPNTALKGCGQLRKVPSHFGWDWGPCLPPAGVERSIAIEAYDARIEDLRIEQFHEDGRVTVTAEGRLNDDACPEGLRAALDFTSPDGETVSLSAGITDSGFAFEIPVDAPKLWWCSGLGDQPLYSLSVTLIKNDAPIDTVSKKIGLRTIRLDTAPDDLGRNFRFVINGVPIFVRGADWIPSDIFITRSTGETYDFYVRETARSNMNLIRVWGGGRYECDDFYDACDRYGILVWQDFCFACNSYPFNDQAFLNNVYEEVKDNVRRLRHRASLALWCGNNENELFAGMMKKQPLWQMNIDFYHFTLNQWLRDFDALTEYWPGSPSSGVRGEKPQDLTPGKIAGDAHLWQVWHGLQPIEAYKNYHTRLCTEFGMESMPSMKAVRSFTSKKDLKLSDPVLKLHQKCEGGNEKMLYYLLAKYRNPAEFEDFVYLSQLVQSGAMRYATDIWRRNIGRQNGATFWQLNDCWPVASWAGIDYCRQLKAVMYHARSYNKPLCLINDYAEDGLTLYVVNEYPTPFSGGLLWSVRDFYGNEILSGETELTVASTAASEAAAFSFSSLPAELPPEKVYIDVILKDADGVRDRKQWLLVPDRDACLPKPAIRYDLHCENGVATVTFRSVAYARYVYLESSCIDAPWSDNFFDLLPGEEKTVTAEMKPGTTAALLRSSLKFKTLVDVKAKGTAEDDRRLRRRLGLKPSALISRLVFKWFI